MAITFIQEKNKQRYLVLIFALVVFTVLFVIWWGFLKKEKPAPPTVQIFLFRETKINWPILKNPKLQELLPFGEISPFKDKAGRENPFTPY